MAQSKQKLKIACLHGYGTNSKFLQRQMRSFQKHFSRQIQFHFVEGVYPAPQAYILDNKLLKIIQGQTKSWSAMKSYHLDYQTYVELFLQNIKNALQKESESYDGLLGFSQGGTMVHAILKLHQNGKIKWKCLQNLKFCIFVCSTSWEWRNKSSSLLTIPSLHLLSKADFLFRKSLFVTIQFENPIIMYHPFGHSFPRLGRQEIGLISQFIKQNKQAKNQNKLMPKL